MFIEVTEEDSNRVMLLHVDSIVSIHPQSSGAWVKLVGGNGIPTVESYETIMKKLKWMKLV